MVAELSIAGHILAEDGIRGGQVEYVTRRLSFWAACRRIYHVCSYQSRSVHGMHARTQSTLPEACRCYIQLVVLEHPPHLHIDHQGCPVVEHLD